MQGPLKFVARYFIQTAQSVAADWNKFWYTPAEPTLAGRDPDLTGLMLLYTHAVWGLALRDFFSLDRWLSPAPGPPHAGKPIRLFVLVPGAGWLDLARLRRSRW